MKKIYSYNEKLILRDRALEQNLKCRGKAISIHGFKNDFASVSFFADELCNEVTFQFSWQAIKHALDNKKELEL